MSFTTFSTEIFRTASKNKRKILAKINRVKDFLNKQSTEKLSISLEELTKEKMLNKKYDKKL